MKASLFIVISGYPCTGKSHLGRLIKSTFNIPFISKDDISEIIYDSLMLKPNQWSRLYAGTAYNVLYFTIESLLSANRSLVVESAFDPRYDNEKLKKVSRKYKLSPLQIYMKANPDIILKRYKERIKEPDAVGKSHPIHFAYRSANELEEKIRLGKHDKLDFGAENYELDTSDFSKIDYTEVMNKIKSLSKK